MKKYIFIAFTLFIPAEVLCLLGRWCRRAERIAFGSKESRPADRDGKIGRKKHDRVTNVLFLPSSRREVEVAGEEANYEQNVYNKRRCRNNKYVLWKWCSPLPVNKLQFPSSRSQKEDRQCARRTACSECIDMDMFLPSRHLLVQILLKQLWYCCRSIAPFAVSHAITCVTGRWAEMGTTREGGRKRRRNTYAFQIANKEQKNERKRKFCVNIDAQWGFMLHLAGSQRHRGQCVCAAHAINELNCLSTVCYSRNWVSGWRYSLDRHDSLRSTHRETSAETNSPMLRWLNELQEIVEISWNPVAMHSKLSKETLWTAAHCQLRQFTAYRADNVISFVVFVPLSHSKHLIHSLRGNRISATHVDAYVSARGGHSH